MKPSRREVLVTIAALAAPAAAEGQAAFLSAPELAWLAAFTDVIIPRTDTPGASDAGVPAYIDRRLAASPTLAERVRSGMQTFDAEAKTKFGAAFPALTAQQQIEFLTARQDDSFFRIMKNMTIDGYYPSRAGLSEELGWHGNTFLPEFKGCTHPEHQS
jgi:hypothetical protein